MSSTEIEGAITELHLAEKALLRPNPAVGDKPQAHQGEEGSFRVLAAGGTPGGWMAVPASTDSSTPVT
jgi:hypothetical protein